jgi:hypothetical protein
MGLNKLKHVLDKSRLVFGGLKHELNKSQHVFNESNEKEIKKGGMQRLLRFQLQHMTTKFKCMFWKG